MGLPKYNKNDVFSFENAKKDSSIPAPSTHLGGQKAPFLSSTDKILTVGCMRQPKIYDAKKDITKQWYVEFYCVDPSDGISKRIRKMHNINDGKTVKERMELAEVWRIHYKNILNEGWNYFTHFIDVVNLSTNPNIISCIETYLAEKQGRVAAKTFKKYRQILNTFKDWLESNRLAHLRIYEVNKRILLQHLNERMIKKSWSNKTYNNILLDLSTFFNHHINNYDDILSKNPLRGVTRLREKVKGHTAYSDQQMAELKEIMSEHDPYMLFFCETVYETCTRPQTETRLLKCGMFDFQRSVLRITSDIAKNDTTDYVPLRKDFLERLKEYGVDKAPADHYLFTRKRKPDILPIREQSIQSWYKKIKIKAKLNEDYTIYSWKHTRNIHVWLDTKDVMFIKTLNRHKTLEMTMKYLRDLGGFVDNNDLINKTRKF